METEYIQSTQDSTINHPSNYLRKEQLDMIDFINNYTWDFVLTISYNPRNYDYYFKHQIYQDILTVNRFLGKLYKSQVLYFGIVVVKAGITHIHILFHIKKKFSYDHPTFIKKRFFLFLRTSKKQLHEVFNDNVKMHPSTYLLYFNKILTSNLSSFTLDKIYDQTGIVRYMFKLDHWKKSYYKDGYERIEVEDYFFSEKLKRYMKTENHGSTISDIQG